MLLVDLPALQALRLVRRPRRRPVGIECVHGVLPCGVHSLADVVDLPGEGLQHTLVLLLGFHVAFRGLGILSFAELGALLLDGDLRIGRPWKIDAETMGPRAARKKRVISIWLGHGVR